MNMSSTIRFCLAGASGRMGRAVIQASRHWKGIELVSVVGLKTAGLNLRQILGPEAPDLEIQKDLASAFKKDSIDVLVDLTEPSCALAHALCALENRISPVIGTSGLKNPDLEKIEKAAVFHKTPALLARNFSIGAVLTMKFSQIAAKFIPQAEIIEIHHDQKLDAPSGTALQTARMIQEGRTQSPGTPETQYLFLEGVRGGKYEDTPIHSLRLKGIMAQQTVIFGGPGESLEIRHNTTDRSVYMAGIELSIRHVKERSGLTIGIESLLGL